MTEYCFKELITLKGAKNASVNAIGAELAAIAGAGRLTPDAVVETARNPASAMHGMFDWDDAVAAAKWRIEQARAVIRHIHIIDDENNTRPAFLSVSTAGSKTQYQPVEAVARSREMQVAVLAAAKRDLDAYTIRYRALKEICDLVEPAKKALSKRLEAHP